MLITTTDLKYEDVSGLEFYTFLEEIKRILEKDAPEWHIEKNVIPDGKTVLFHIRQWDYSNRNKTWPIFIDKHVFAYTTNDKFYILNQPPVREIKKENNYV